MSLVNGKDTPTDCSISEQYGTKTYCFGDQAAHDLFMKSPAENLAKAQANYSKMFPTEGARKIADVCLPRTSAASAGKCQMQLRPFLTAGDVKFEADAPGVSPPHHRI